MTVRQNICSVVAGAISGVMILGIGGKLALRAMAILTRTQCELSAEGSTDIFVFSILLGIIGGLVFPLVARHLPASQAAAGGAFGLLMYIVLIPMIPAGMSETALAHGEWLSLSVAVFGLLFLGFGVAMDVLGNGLRSLSKIRIERNFVQKRVTTGI